MLDICIDLETMGTTPDSAIVGLGAVEFDLTTGKTGRTFFRAMNLAEQVKLGRIMEASTVAWWLSQNKEAQNAIIWSTYPVRDALGEFAEFIDECSMDLGGRKQVRVWGNGPSFDNAMLAHCYWMLGIERPWAFWNDRCVRTIRALYPKVVADEFVGEKHNAVDDAMAQALHLCKIRNSLKKS